MWKAGSATVMDRRPAALAAVLPNLERGGICLKPVQSLMSPTGVSDSARSLVQVTAADGVKITDLVKSGYLWIAPGLRTVADRDLNAIYR
jgi:hypothetical protein